MSGRGEVLERMTVVAAADGESLEALFARGAGEPRTPVVLAASHPRLGGSMDAPLLTELVWQLARAGHPTLRFNWRGVGASTGTSSLPWLLPGADEGSARASLVALDAEVSDLTAAVDHHAHGAPRCAVVGVGLGALVASLVAAAHDKVDEVVLIAPPVALAALPLPPVQRLSAAGVRCAVFAMAGDAAAPLHRLEAVFGAAVRSDAGGQLSLVRSVVRALGR